MKPFIQKFWTNKWLLSIVSGILLGLSFPPFPFPFLQFPAFILVFRLIFLCNSAKEAAYFIYPGFLIWNIITTYWLMMASLAAGIAAILANGVLMALVVMLQFEVQKKLRNGWLIALLQTAFWVSFEYLHHQWDLAWPWLTLGNGWSSLPSLIQYISATGFWGISFWVVFSSSLLYQVMQHRQEKLMLGAVTGLLLFPGISLIQLSQVSTKSNDTIETVVAQPNFDSYQDLGGFETPEQTLDLLFEISDSVRTPDTKLIVWPENGIHPYLSNRETVSYAARQSKNRLKNRAASWNTTIIGGSTYYEYYSKENHPALPRWTGGTPFLGYNAAIGFYPNQSTQVYRKHNLVPIVERFPFVHFFNTVDVFGLVNWEEIQSYGKGYEAVQFKAGHTKTPALICYDSVYPSWVREFVQNGAGFITIITNDGWWGNTSGHAQHFAYARLRAIEFRRWVVRSANNGISGIIAPNGVVKVKTDYWTRNTFRYDVPVLTKKTLYTRYGDWLPLGLFIISVGGMGIIFLSSKNN